LVVVNDPFVTLESRVHIPLNDNDKEVRVKKQKRISADYYMEKESSSRRKRRRRRRTTSKSPQHLHADGLSSRHNYRVCKRQLHKSVRASFVITLIHFTPFLRALVLPRPRIRGHPHRYRSQP
jgi:hypothetical protein